MTQPTAKRRSRKAPSWQKQQEMLAEIGKLQTVHSNAQYDFLEKCGWQYTCDNPASIWGWRKKLPDGVVAFCPQDFAIRIQENLDEG